MYWFMCHWHFESASRNQVSDTVSGHYSTHSIYFSAPDIGISHAAMNMSHGNDYRELQISEA